MEIKIQDTLADTLTRLAAERNQTTTQYIEEFIDSHLLSQLRANLVRTIETQKREDVITMETAVKDIKEQVKVRDEVKEEVIVEEPVKEIIEEVKEEAVLTDNEIIE